MINRALIRVKVVQVLYSNVIKQENDLRKIEKELNDSLDKSYELYNMLLQLIVELTKLEEREQDEARNKYFPTEEELNPNTRFVDNRLAQKLREDVTLGEYIGENLCTWTDNPIFIHLLLDKIKRSATYMKYMEAEEVGLKEDCDLWRNLMKKVIFNDDIFKDELESRSVYWNDDLDTMGQFALKTIKRIEEQNEPYLLPKYKNDEDYDYAIMLLEKSFQGREDSDELIDTYVKKESWSPERIGLMERLIMDVAIAEMRSFVSIPINVTLNEFIEIAKYYGNQESGKFVNGILHSVSQQIRAERSTGKF